MNDFRFGLSIITTGSTPQVPFTAAQLGISSPLGNLFPGMPEISVANYFDLGANPFSDNSGIEKTYTVGDSLSWQKGRHSLKFGVEYKHHNLNEDFNLYTSGQIFFLGLLPSGPFAGNGFYDFLGGLFDSTGLTIMGSGVNNRNVSAHDWGGFVNDDWHLTDRLTLTLGLRYEYFGPFTEAQGRFVGFDPSRLVTPPFRISRGRWRRCSDYRRIRSGIQCQESIAGSPGSSTVAGSSRQEQFCAASRLCLATACRLESLGGARRLWHLLRQGEFPSPQ